MRFKLPRHSGSLFQTFATWLLCLWGVAFTLPSVAQDAGLAERRVALVVGNSNYKIGALKNPGNDARAVAAMLRRMHFEVLERQNLTREGFSVAAREFGDRLKGASVALFYFAGHGLQVKGRNFLVPVDADIAREDEVPYRSLDVSEILDKMDSARTPINLVLLDACRNNPFARSFKLGQVGLAQMDAPAGTLIAFATSPGSVAQDGDGDNGLYTGALLRHMGTEALPVEQLLKRVRVDVGRLSNNGQVPWESSSLNRDFMFVPGRSVPVMPQSAGSLAAASLSATELGLELAFWDTIKASSNPADYRAYLEQYPAGRFAALARIRIGTPGEPRVATSLLASASPSIAPASASAVSPEGLYVATLSSGKVVLSDRVQKTTLRTIVVDRSERLLAERVMFSPDGRWLSVGGSLDDRPMQYLVMVSSGAVVWERSASSLAFESARPGAVLTLVGGQTERVELR